MTAVSVTIKNADKCALTIQKSRIVKRKAVEHEIKFINNGQQFIISFKANRKYLSVHSYSPLKGIRSCVEHDGTLVKKLKMGYFNDQEVQLTEKGNMMLTFLINDVTNTANLAKHNPNIIFGYYQLIREKLQTCLPSLTTTRIKHQLINQNPYTTLLSDSIRKKHFFSYNGVNMFLSFQAIVENHPELFSALMN